MSFSVSCAVADDITPLLKAVPSINDKLAAILLLFGVVCVTVYLSLIVAFMCVVNLTRRQKGLSQREARTPIHKKALSEH